MVKSGTLTNTMDGLDKMLEKCTPEEITSIILLEIPMRKIEDWMNPGDAEANPEWFSAKVYRRVKAVPEWAEKKIIREISLTRLFETLLMIEAGAYPIIEFTES